VFPITIGWEILCFAGLGATVVRENPFYLIFSCISIYFGLLMFIESHRMNRVPRTVKAVERLDSPRWWTLSMLSASLCALLTAIWVYAILVPYV